MALHALGIGWLEHTVHILHITVNELNTGRSVLIMVKAWLSVKALWQHLNEHTNIQMNKNNPQVTCWQACSAWYTTVSLLVELQCVPVWLCHHPSLCNPLPPPQYPARPGTQCSWKDGTWETFNRPHPPPTCDHSSETPKGTFLPSQGPTEVQLHQRFPVSTDMV